MSLPYNHSDEDESGYPCVCGCLLICLLLGIGLLLMLLASQKPAHAQQLPFVKNSPEETIRGTIYQHRQVKVKGKKVWRWVPVVNKHNEKALRLKQQWVNRYNAKLVDDGVEFITPKATRKRKRK